MKLKRNLHKDIDQLTISQKQWTPLHTNSALSTKRKQDKQNKENNIQVTQPLQAHTYPSKQFILSRQSISHNPLKLKEINQNQTRNLVEKSLIKKVQDKQQQFFDRRLSLKCTKSLSQQLESQKSHRLSVAPQRRQSLNSYEPPLSMIDDKDSISSSYQHSMIRKESKGKPDFKKQTIITNFMNKLDHQEDLRSIIESKLKNGSASSQSFVKQKRNQSYITDFTEDNSVSGLSTKLKNCENQLKFFKNTLKQLSEKIVELTSQQKNFKKKDNKVNTADNMSNQSKCELVSLLKQISNLSKNCNKCQKKQTRQCGVQTKSENAAQNKNSVKSQSFDFFDNLEKTLKILDGKKN